MYRPEHFTILATDTERAIAFYSALFGWRFVKRTDSVDRWAVLTGDPATRGIDGSLVARNGIFIGNPELKGFANAFICTVSVPDLDAICKRIATLGGFAFPKTHAPGVGWRAVAKDTEGNFFAVLQSDRKQ